MGLCTSHLINNVRHYCKSCMASTCDQLANQFGFPRCHFVDRCKPNTSAFACKSCKIKSVILKLKQFLFQALTLLIYHCGCKKAMIIMTRWPSYLLLPMFSIYTFGAKTVRSRKYLVLSTNWTWVNFFLTLCGLTFGTTFVYLQPAELAPPFYYHAGYIICFPLIFFTLFTFSCLRYLKACCCYIFDISFIQQYGLDIESLQVVNFEELTCQSDIEMSPHVQVADDSDF